MPATSAGMTRKARRSSLSVRYAIVIEKADGNYSAYVPDLPGCIATGETVQADEAEIRDAIRFHIEGLKALGLPISAPTSSADYVEA
jgi:predicted RNase H-like HicB family nuclease